MDVVRFINIKNLPQSSYSIRIIMMVQGCYKYSINLKILLSCILLLRIRNLNLHCTHFGILSYTLALAPSCTSAPSQWCTPGSALWSTHAPALWSTAACSHCCTPAHSQSNIFAHLLWSTRVLFEWSIAALALSGIAAHSQLCIVVRSP